MADEAQKTTRYSVRNTTNGPKGINTPDGPVEVRKGQTRNVSLTDGEKASSERMGWFEFGDPVDDDFVDEDGDGVADSVDRDELKKQAAELGLEFPANIPTDRLKGLVDQKLAS